MLERINGICYKNMIDYGIRNLDKYCDVVNDLNVFPVPDGDTGTNMVMTMKNGLYSIDESSEELSEVASKFAKAVVFGARGNSGVIVSQFFKGMSEGFGDVDEADVLLLIHALEKGVETAYQAVAIPTEGTILTVVREATEALKANSVDLGTVSELLDYFIKEAKISLEQTPDKLPVLKKAGVVDSGGAGLIYLFEGMKKYLDGELIDEVVADDNVKYIDYSEYDKDSKFAYGYCTELLIQLLNDKLELDYAQFKKDLSVFGDSVVTSFDIDKVRVHIHTFYPEKVLKYCHRYGEFLNLKIENMTVQHTKDISNIVCSSDKGECDFAIVAVAPDRVLQDMFIEMGADVVIMSVDNPSSKEFIEAFEYIDNKEILVFPNSSNSILAAMQAGSLHKNNKVTVLNCRSVAECYASLAIINFEETDTNVVVDSINEVINNLYIVSVAQAIKTMSYGNKNIVENDYIALSGEKLLVTAKDIESAVIEVIQKTMKKQERSVVTMFCSNKVSKKQIDNIMELIIGQYAYLEVYTIPVEDSVYDLTISFE